MHNSITLWVALAQPASLAPTGSLPAARELVVEAGKFDRQEVVVRVQLEEPDGKKRWKLQDERGRLVPFQIDELGRAAFVLEKLAAGQRATFRLSEEQGVPRAPVARVRVEGKQAVSFKVFVDGRPALEFQGQPLPRSGLAASLARGGFVHPAYSPSGTILTESSPPDQPRHLGIWSFWNEIRAGKETLDLWNKPQSAAVQAESMGPSWNGAVHGGFESRQILIGRQGFGGQTLLRDKWRVLVYARPRQQPYFVVDLESEQSVAGELPVHVPKGDEGGIAVRTRPEWRKDRPGAFWLTAQVQPATPRPTWVYSGGVVSGRVAGIAVLGYPGNFGAPQALAKTSAEGVINFVPHKDQAIAIEPNRPLRAHYRFVLLDGKPDPKLLDRLWNDYAFPPQASVKRRP